MSGALISAPGSLCAEVGQGLPPFPTPLCPLAASGLRFAPDGFLLTKPNTLPHNRVASVATLRWCSGSSRNAVRLPFGISVQLRRNPQQYNELGGIQDSEVPGKSGNPAYTAKLQVLDSDFSQYIHDNTDDEITHFTFLNAYLQSKGAQPVSLEQFRTLPGSKATGSSGQPRLTNLMQLTVDTSWWTRYRSSDNNPDLDPNFTFPQAVPDLSKGQFTAIPRTDDDLSPDAHIQAIANTAGFHMPTIEQGGTTLYPALAQRASSAEVLRILISIGPTETMHFQTWQDKAGNAPPLTDPTNNLTFPDLNSPPLGG